MRNILLVEDDPDDIELFGEALKETGLMHHVEVITEGDQVIPHLEKKTTLPDVIVLDLNLPKLQGKEILSQLKTFNHLSKIPVVILTTSGSKADVEECLAAGALKFITKPVNTEGFQVMARDIFEVASNHSA